MLPWQIISFVILLVVWLVNGNPLPVKTENDVKVEQATTSRLIRRIQNDYLCNYYASPAYDQSLVFSPLSSSSYRISLRAIRERCRYLEEPSQKYSVWDLVR